MPPIRLRSKADLALKYILATGLAGLTGKMGYKAYRKFRSKRKAPRRRFPLPKSRRVGKLSQRALQTGTGGSFSKFFYGRNRLRSPMRQIYQKTSKNYLSYDSANTIYAMSASQSFKTVLSMFDKYDLLNNHSRCVPGGSTGINTSQVCHESCTAEVSLTNQTNTNTRVVIWDIISRRDAPASTDFRYPESTLNPGLSDEDQGYLPGDSASSYCFNPFNVELFTQYFKVKKMTHILLAEGQTHVHRIHYAPNRVLNGAYLKNQTYGLRGLTCYTMIQVFGTPANNDAETPVISTTWANLDVVCKKSYRFGYIENNRTTYDAYTSLVPINPEVIDIADGAVEPEVTA